MIVPPHEDVAGVFVEDREVGTVWWSMTDEPLVCVEIEPSSVLLVQGWAKELGGEFFPEREI